MKLSLKNIAKIKDAEIELNGITVIAGENNTGKSTIGKALFSAFNSLHNISEQINHERVTTITQYINSFSDYNLMFYENHQELIHNILDKSPQENNPIEYIKKELEKIQFPDLPDSSNGQIEKIDDLAKSIKKIIDISNDEILNTISTRRLKSEFNGQTNNIYSNDKGIINLSIKDRSSQFTILNETVIEIANSQNLNAEAVYIDDPFILDETLNRFPRFFGRYHSAYDHRTFLVEKLKNTQIQSTAVDEIIINNKLNQIYQKLSSVCSGRVVWGRPGPSYLENESEKELNIKNISTGLKTFVILKILLENGILEQNGTIILDEPEIHLHPQWQLLLAEIIVLLQKEFNMHILLNTHSPYFLKAIEVYSAKHEIADKCNYYLAASENDTSKIVDVTYNTEEIYKLLAKPLQDLENVRFEND